MGLTQVVTFGSDVAVVEGVVGGLKLFKQLESDPRAELWIFDAVDAAIPRANDRYPAKRVAAVAAERVQVDDRGPQVLAHRLAFADPVGVGPAEREAIVAAGTFELDLWDVRKCSHG